MARLQLKLSGVDGVQRSVSRWEVKKIAAVRALIKRTANNIRRNAKRRAPVKTGRLQKSIQVKLSRDKLAAFVRAVAPYSHIVEYGSSVTGAQPRPFMQPAFDGQKSKYETALKKIFEEV